MRAADARVVVTGGAGGIGSAIAAEFLAAGASVLLADRDEAALGAAAQRLGGTGERLATAATNLAQAAGRSALCGQVALWRGNVLVNNAGVNHFGLFEELGPEAIAETVAINVLAPMLLVQELLPHLRAQPAARILNVGSVFGSIGYPGYVAYSASKFAMRGFSEALRRELSGTTVKVHYLAPRATRTRINTGAVERMNAELGVAMDPPETVAQAARRLLEDEIDGAVVGWPEKFFARLNAVLPGLVDGAIAKQLPVIRRYAGRTAPASEQQELRRRTV